jgi:hypothetical protein
MLSHSSLQIRNTRHFGATMPRNFSTRRNYDVLLSHSPLQRPECSLLAAATKPAKSPAHRNHLFLKGMPELNPLQSVPASLASRRFSAPQSEGVKTPTNLFELSDWLKTKFCLSDWLRLIGCAEASLNCKCLHSRSKQRRET